MPTAGKPIIVAITGASGAVYGRRLLQLLVRAGRPVRLVVSVHGGQLLAAELGVAPPEPRALLGFEPGEQVIVHRHDDVAAPIASGSFATAGMVICPCSVNTLATVAAGLADNLVARAAQVTLKEARRLVLVIRETPLSAIDIENMARLVRAGAIICPAAPGFYHHPQTIDDLVDFIAGKALDLLGVEHDLATRYRP